MPKTVLLIDDQELVIRIVQVALKPLGAHLPSAKNGADAIRYIEANGAPDAIILDFSMPDLDGLETLRLIRKLPAGGGIPVAMLTTRDQTSIREAARDLRVFDFITKPFSPSSLLQTVTRMLETGEQATHGA